VFVRTDDTEKSLEKDRHERYYQEYLDQLKQPGFGIRNVLFSVYSR